MVMRASERKDEEGRLKDEFVFFHPSSFSLHPWVLLFVFLAPALCTAADPSPLAGIAFVGGPVVDRLDDEYAGAYHWRDGYVYPKGATFNAWERTHSAPRPGRNLFSLIPATPDGKLTQLTYLKDGSVWDPEPSFDGQKILFSMRKDGEDWYHLFEINIDGTGLKQLTDGPFNDISGVYLPDGRIVFCSDRSGVLDEYHEERSEFLYRMQADGTGIEQITFVPGIYFEPTVLKNGSIVCSFWDAFHISVAPFIKHETYLITLRPDGTEERHLFGAGEYKFYNRTRHSAIGLTRPGELPDGRLLLQSEMGPSIYDPDLGTSLGVALAPVFPGTASAQTGGTTHAIHLSPLGTRTSPYPLADGRFLMAGTLPGSRDLGIYVVDPSTRAMELVFDRPNQSEWDAVPIAASRVKPRILPDKERDITSEFATFIVAAGRHSDTRERNELNRRARFVRVIQAEYTGVTTSSHTSLETRILGTVPLLPDGSVAFEAPAETPLFLETLDARGNRLVLQAGYMAARAGEIKSCTGCHSPQSEAVANSKLQALDLPLPRITRESSDLSYRRNDPDEYRRQAIVTQSPRYQEWLQSPTAEIRRRGTEMLSFLSDEVTPADRQRFVESLKDNSADVSRQAALTLAHVGSAEQLPALIALLEENATSLPPLGRGGRGDRVNGTPPSAGNSSKNCDWQTLHYTLMALEAITGENLDRAASLDSASTWIAWWKETGSVAKFLKSLTARGDSFADDFARDAWLEAVARTRWLAQPESRNIVDSEQARWQEKVRALLTREDPPLAAVRAAGMLADRAALPLLSPLLVRGGHDKSDETCPDCDDALRREAVGTAIAKEAATALGRIGSDEAVNQLWEIMAKTVPNPAPFASRHYQTGPRPEEYTYLRALIQAGAVPRTEHVPFLIGLLPYTEGEKPRFEDRAKSDSQRVWLGRILLERAALRRPIVELASAVLAGNADPDNELYKFVLAGTNIDRPRSEHGRIFPVIPKLEAEQALHLLSCLAESSAEIPEPLVAQRLRSDNHRERIEAAVIFRRFAYSAETETILRDEAARPYPFREIWSIGKGRPDTQFRDKAYFLMALGAHARNLKALEPYTDADRFFRDVRLGLAIGLGFRGTPDAIPLLDRLARDPIFLVHRECTNASVEIRDAEILVGRTPPEWKVPPRIPRGNSAAPFEFVERAPEPIGLPGSVSIDANEPDSVVKALRAAVAAEGYKNVANSFARNAERMRLTDAGGLAKIIESPAAREAPLTPELEQALTAAIDSPFPFAHCLAARLIALRGENRFATKLAEKLPAWIAAADTVGVYWGADALGRLRALESRETLLNIAVDRSFDRTFGSVGMAYGFAASRALGMLSADTNDEAIRALTTSDNVWLQAGVLDGLVERLDRSIAPALEDLSVSAPSALLAEEARYGLKKLNAADRRRAEIKR